MNSSVLMVSVGKNIELTLLILTCCRRTWYPEGLKLLEGKGNIKVKKPTSSVSEHHLNDKTIADVCEALIGASLLSYHETKNMDMAVKAVTVFVGNPDHDAQSWDDYFESYTSPAWMTREASAAHQSLADKLKMKMNYQFRYPRLARCAFMHPSYPFTWEKIPSYQRLEFLGDALLDMTCVEYLFFKHLDRDPQWLTEHKVCSSLPCSFTVFLQVMKDGDGLEQISWCPLC